MIIHKKLKPFLELIFMKGLRFQTISCKELSKNFKNNEYYNLKNFCLENELIEMHSREISLTINGIEFFNFLKKLRKI
jgi:hypothetical protein